MSEPKVIVIHRADGTVERYPIGYGGQLCRQAANPYQDADALSGPTTDTATSEACLPEVTQLDLAASLSQGA